MMTKRSELKTGVSQGNKNTMDIKPKEVILGYKRKKTTNKCHT